MSHSLRPRQGFNWTAVSWGGPDEPMATTCSYCDAELDDDFVPLIIWNKDSWAAQFCEACCRTWWGMEA
ncbi:MAG TPA: hypothetical protein VL614_00615 [Acetobacteraceae bacterium]|jgi:hypothetical protein|nr:hypothetical protein [Acetobacteraceae bacterium]